MIKIAVCDDESIYQACIVESLQHYFAARPSLVNEISVFADGAVLLADVAEHGAFDLYLLDILMPEMNGIELGRRLRSKGDRGELIFLTNSNDFAADSYDVAAFFYLLKPVQQEKLFSVLDQVIEKIHKRHQAVVIVQTTEGTRRIKLEDICYAERVGRCMRYYCTNDTIDTPTIRQPFREMAAPLLADRRFWLCGASFVLNFQHVSGVTGQTALLDNGKAVVLPRTAAVEFKKAWGNYWLEEADT